MKGWLLLLALLLAPSPAPAQGTFCGLNCILNGNLTVNKEVTNPRTTSWFSNDTPPSNDVRFGDHLFVGDAATNYTNTNACPTGNWFSNFEATTSNGACGYIGSFQAVFLSDASKTMATAGILGAGQTLHNNSNGAFGVMGFALNNNASSTAGAFAGYFECDEVSAAPSGCSVEIDSANLVSDGQAGSPDAYTQSAIVDLQLACGSGISSPTTYKCGSAIQIVPNTQLFKVGVNFLTGSVVSGTFFGGTASPAIVLPTNYALIWYSSAGTPSGGIQVDGAGNVRIAGTSLIFNGTTITVP